MSKFDKTIEILVAARTAQDALKWFDQFGENDMSITAPITVDAHVYFGSATPSGKSAQTYVGKASRLLAGDILVKARALAEEDFQKGDALVLNDEEGR